MERISSRKNPYILHLRRLAADGDYRRAAGEFVCDGEKLLLEAVAAGARVTSVLRSQEGAPIDGAMEYLAPPELMEYASPLKNSPGPVFSIRIPEIPKPNRIDTAIILENVQDPGNVGTIIRAADALGVDAVILTGDCADLYAPRTARATMGAVFRQPVIRIDQQELPALLSKHNLPLYGAALRDDAVDIRSMNLCKAAVAVGNEGSGLSEDLLSKCEKSLIIPISQNSESLNAAMAATIIMWEMIRFR